MKPLFFPSNHLGIRCYHNSKQSVRRKLMSNLFQPLNEIPQRSLEQDKLPKKFEEFAAKSHRMLTDFGLIRSCHPGSFAYLPLALRSIEKLNRLIDFHMEEIGAQKILLPTMTDGTLWKKSGRWNLIQSELFRLKNRHDQDFVLGPTFEESITSLVASIGSVPWKSLPLKLYQTSSKFRDEKRSKYGLMRSKEFIMKDLYTFDADIKHAEETYNQVRHAYDKLLASLNVPYVSVQGDPGAIGGSFSHEYHFLCDIGDDQLVMCNNCGSGINQELGEVNQCTKCQSSDLKSAKGVEVGHTFLLGDKYSKLFKAEFTNKNGKPEIMQMGCFGLGVSRMLASALEVLSDENRLIWPEKIVPYKMAIIGPKGGSKEYAAIQQVYDLYDQLDSSKLFNDEVILDDRESYTVGRKLREAQKTGYSHIVLFGKDCIDKDNPVVELYDNANDMFKLPVNQVLCHFESLNKHAY